ncbi:MAG: hypothetical protein ABFS18_12050 [Thermodesulfobacteriota bacterium]
MTVLGKLREIIALNDSSANAWSIIRECLLCCFLFILVFLLYVQSKDGPFVFDDQPNITSNPHIKISDLGWQSLRRAAFDSPIPTRPNIYGLVEPSPS